MIGLVKGKIVVSDIFILIREFNDPISSWVFQEIDFAKRSNTPILEVRFDSFIDVGPDNWTPFAIISAERDDPSDAIFSHYLKNAGIEVNSRED